MYQEIASGAKAQRPQLEQMLAQLRSGDVLVVWKLDRSGRSLPHLVRLAGQPTAAAGHHYDYRNRKYDAEI
ncbi:hypothetical protein CMK17_19785 [Candidatus Poribacteria bacterium]|nr:hypothetical protein [Candidatus Poribacteria bacterium]